MGVGMAKLPIGGSMKPKKIHCEKVAKEIKSSDCQYLQPQICVHYHHCELQKMRTAYLNEIAKRNTPKGVNYREVRQT